MSRHTRTRARAASAAFTVVLSVTLLGCQTVTGAGTQSVESTTASERPSAVGVDDFAVETAGGGVGVNTTARVTIRGKNLHEDAVAKKARGTVTVELLTTREIGDVVPSHYIGIPDFKARGRFYGLRWRLHNDTNRAVVPAPAFGYQIAVTDGHDFWSVWTNAERYPNNAPGINTAYNYSEGEADPAEPVVPGHTATMWSVFQVPTAVEPLGLLVDVKGLRKQPPIPLPPVDGQQPVGATPESEDAQPIAPVDGPPVPDARPVPEPEGDCPFATDLPAWVVFDEMTRSWQVTICQTVDDRYMYHGVKHADPAAAITLPADLLSPFEYEAVNNGYRYVVTLDELTVWHDADVLVREEFLPGE